MTTGVLVMAYGTPAGLEDVGTFYADVRRGRTPSPEQLDNLVARYLAIGGVSPLNARTAAQLVGLGNALEAIEPGAYAVRYGAKHAAPRVEEAVDAIAAEGIDQLVGLVLAPHYSRLSVGEYVERAAAQAARRGLACAFVEQWHDDEALVAVLAERVGAGAEALAGRSGGPLEVVFSAHSLPARILETGDPYPGQLAETASLVAARAGLASYRTAWQSAGRTPEPWLGPDILEVLPTLAGEGFASVLVCPAGFTSDHLEILYDLDVEARAAAERLGLGFARTGSLNDEPRVMAALARRIAAARAGIGR